MNVNGIGKQPCYERTNGVGKNNRNHGGSFSRSLSENLNGRAENDSVREENAASAASVISAAFPYRNLASPIGLREQEKAGTAGSGDNRVKGAGKAGGDRVRTDAADEKQAVRVCEAKHLSYQESDYFEACAAEGYTLAARINRDSRSVYVEQKMEDGTLKGYEVQIDWLEADTEDPIERAALEAWEKKTAGGENETEENEALTVEEALLQFYEFIEDRIKNGPPKYMIGNSEFSVEEWDKLLEDFDDQLDALREELRERIEAMKEQQELAEASGDLQHKRDEVQEAAEEDTEEKLLTALFQNHVKI